MKYPGKVSVNLLPLLWLCAGVAVTAPPAGAAGPPCPARIRLCEKTFRNGDELRHCGMLTWNGTQYDAAFDSLMGPQGPVGPKTQSIIACTRDGTDLVLTRTDLDGMQLSATYHGAELSTDHAEGAIFFHTVHEAYRGTFTADYLPADSGMAAAGPVTGSDPAPAGADTAPSGRPEVRATLSDLPTNFTLGAILGGSNNPPKPDEPPVTLSPPGDRSAVASWAIGPEVGEGSAGGPPQIVRLCERRPGSPVDCAVLTWSGSAYAARWDSGRTSTVAVGAFDRQHVVLKLVDEASPAGEVLVYEGRPNARGVIYGSVSRQNSGQVTQVWNWTGAAGHAPPTASEIAAERERGAKAIAGMAQERAKLWARAKATPPPPATASCNPSRLAAADTAQILALGRKDFESADTSPTALDDATCLGYAGAMRGDRMSERLYASALTRQLEKNKVDPAQAYIWAKLSAEDGGTSSSSALALLYLDGKGAPADSLRANYYGFVAKFNHDNPSGALSSPYCDVDNPAGLTAEDAIAAWALSMANNDIRGAMCWQVIAAEAGDPDMQALVGIELLQGFGFAEDDTAAFQLLAVSAAAGQPGAEFYLSRCYMTSTGTRKDLDKSRYWYAKSQELPEGIAVANYYFRTINEQIGAALTEAAIKFFNGDYDLPSDKYDVSKAVGLQELRYQWVRRQHAGH